jgi:hypothetical protein
MNKSVFLALAIAACAGCATQPVSDSNASLVPGKRIVDSTYLEAKPGTGQVTLKRDSGIIGAACSVRLFVDAKPIADIRTSEKVVLHLPPAEYVFSAEPHCGGGMREIHGTVRSGEAIAFRVAYGGSLDFAINATAF